MHLLYTRVEEIEQTAAETGLINKAEGMHESRGVNPVPVRTQVSRPPQILEWGGRGVVTNNYYSLIYIL